MPEEDTPERPWVVQQFADDERRPLKVGDVLRVVRVREGVLDVNCNYAQCICYELVRDQEADPAA